MTSLPPGIAEAMAPFPVHRFSVQEYHRLAESGILHEDDEVELLQGWLVPKMTKNPRHDATITRVERVLRNLLPSGWMLRIQSAITTADSEPEPDLAIVREREDDYAASHPTPADIGLIIEIADTSLGRDRQKASIYAAAGIAEYWIVNIQQNLVERYSEPDDSDSAGYLRVTQVTLDQQIPLCLDGKTLGDLAVKRLIPSVG